MVYPDIPWITLVLEEALSQSNHGNNGAPKTPHKLLTMIPGVVPNGLIYLCFRGDVLEVDSH